jgi:tetrahydromethanopterin S-methyltransferase subunit F
MVRMTRGRAWIAVLGVMLAGIVAINVITLSLSAAAGHIDRNIEALEEENSLMRGRDAKLSGSARVRHDAAALGLAAGTTDQIGYVRASRKDVAVAAQRLAAAAGSGY